jgi:L,D-transpeptidase YcbB
MKRARFPLLLLLALASFSVCGFAAPAADRDATALDHYLAAGAPLPAWTQTPGVEAVLAAEAESQGLSLSPPPMAGEQTPAQRRMLAALRLARALAQGAVRPDTVQPDWTIPVPPFDAEAALQRLAASGDPLPWLRSLAPQQEDYQRLRQALARYRSLARAGGWPPLPNGPVVKPGAADPRLPLLRSRLMLEGDLAANAATGTVFDAATEQALRRFQRRHGLAADGRLGGATLAALNVSAEARARQIAANLERWRWLPRAVPDDRIVVNAAAAGLSLVKSGETVLRLRVIVGTPQHPTPVLAARIVSLLLNPPWDIPSSIAAKEIRPRARRDPGYLAREGIVPHGGGLRQLPGPKNALGGLKFEMPNPLDVYLHDTPDKRLFDRMPRFFSHGCIRLEHPQELAQLLLQQDAAASARLEPAIAAETTSRLPVTPTIPIYVLYFTATAAADETVMLYDDLYGRDAPLIAALFPDAPPIDAPP